MSKVNPQNRGRRSRMRLFLIRAPMLVLLAAGLLAIFLPARNQVRLDFQAKQTLLALQQALQKFHVEDEAYPKQSPMSGAKLIQFLMETGHLELPPLNPATLQPYSLETGEPDRIVYTTDELAETYSLKMLQPGSDTPLLVIDSTEHQSLE